MDENFIQYLWRYQKFDHGRLKLTDGRPVSIFNPGVQNLDSGPDFTGAQLRLDGITWSGNVEVHINSNDWYQHKHHLDAAYNNVILHVVWQNKGTDAVRKDGTAIPTLELQPLVSEELLLNYGKLIKGGQPLPCSSHLAGIKDIYLLNMLDKVLVERLERKSHRVWAELEGTGHDWEESAYRMLAENFGFKKNAEPMLRLSRHLPLKIIRKYADRPEQIEALLFGTAGFLTGNPADDYHAFLMKEYRFLKAKFNLPDPGLRREDWKFSKLRPPNFPTLRLAQFSRFLSGVPNLFSNLIRENDLSGFLKNVRVNHSPYWREHFDFGKKTKKPMPGLGLSSLENIVINTFVPVLAAYGKNRDDQSLTDRAVQYLQMIRPEQNRIMKIWQSAGLTPQSAFDSQALIELYNEYCLKRKCAACNIGSVIIGNPQKT